MTISLESLTKAKPLADELGVVRKARNGMNQSPSKVVVWQSQAIGSPNVVDVRIPNAVTRRLLEDEERRLVQELSKLGVQA